MGVVSCSRSTSHLLASVGVALSLFSCLLSLLAFFLPYWVYMVETFTVTDISFTLVMHVHCNYGFWKYCSGMTSTSQTSYSCGDVTTHHAWEQATVCLVLFAFILQLNSIINGALYLIFYKEEKLCLYVAGSSAGGAGVLLLGGVITYGAHEHRIQVSEAFVIPFKLSHLHVSFWCAIASCALSFIVTVLFMLARVEMASEHRGSVLEGVVETSGRFYANSALNGPEQQTSDNLPKQMDIVSKTNFQLSNVPLYLPTSCPEDRDQATKVHSLVLKKIFNGKNDRTPKFLLSKLCLHKRGMNRNSSKMLNNMCSADKSFNRAVDLKCEEQEFTDENVERCREQNHVSNKSRLEKPTDYWKAMIDHVTLKESANEVHIADDHNKHSQLKISDSIPSHKENCKSLDIADRRRRSMTDINTRKIVAQQCPKHLYRSAWDVNYVFENRP